jgi:hypothetical protein
MPRPSHSSRFYHPHNSGWGVQIKATDYTLRICNTHWFSATTMVARTCLIVTLYMACLVISCRIFIIKSTMFFFSCMPQKWNYVWHHYIILNLMLCWPCITVYQYSETNLMHFLFSLLRIKGLYMFRALLAHPQEVLHKRQLVYCVRVMSVGCTRIGPIHVSSISCSSSGGSAQTALGILRAEISRYLKVLMDIVIKA